jgi:hypothetical protein
LLPDLKAWGYGVPIPFFLFAVRVGEGRGVSRDPNSLSNHKIFEVFYTEMATSSQTGRLQFDFRPSSPSPWQGVDKEYCPVNLPVANRTSNRDVANDWFTKWLQKSVAVVLDGVRKPTKVAIIDTGVDGTHQDICNSGQITSFMGFPSELEPLQDATGHGTRSAGAFIRAAPTAQLSIIRISHRLKFDVEEDCKILVNVKS